ncbi:MAG: sulfatase [Phycisphaerales bacterium]|nr:MAG: sulfatase [Phycisphaerales bacterium]
MLLFRGGRPPLNHVLLISIDTLRADHLSYAGYGRETSPAIDRLAAQSQVFANAFAQASSTLPSHASMFTSQYPSVHGAESKYRIPLADSFVTLAEIFRDSGFRTGAFVEGGQLAALWNLDQGFEVYDVTATTGVMGEIWKADDLAGILAKAAAWMEEHRDEPFFCFVQSYVVHMPYQPRPPHDRMFDEGYDGPLPQEFTYEMRERFDPLAVSPDHPDLRHVVALYDGEIRYMDQLVGMFLERLEDLGLAEDLVVVFTSDHGEEFAEHGRVAQHTETLFDELLHVPLLIRVPTMKPQIIRRQVRLIDLPPTLLALMNVDAGDVSFVGSNLLAGGTEVNEDLPVFSELVYPKRHWASLRVDDHKLLAYSPQQHALYDLRTDPREQVDVFDRQDERVTEWVKLLQHIMSENRVRRSQVAAPVELNAEIEEQLRALGYID